MYNGISLIFTRAKPRKMAPTGMARKINNPGETANHKRNRIAPPIATKTNCLSVKGPMIFSSVSINWGTWKRISISRALGGHSFVRFYISQNCPHSVSGRLSYFFLKSNTLFELIFSGFFTSPPVIIDPGGTKPIGFLGWTGAGGIVPPPPLCCWAFCRALARDSA